MEKEANKVGLFQGEGIYILGVANNKNLNYMGFLQY